MLETGAADVIAAWFVSLTMDSSVTMQLSGLMLLMAVLTNIVSNNAAAVIGTPIAIGIANQLSLPLEPFVLAVLFGANMSYATPMAYKTNLLVMTVGGYSFSGLSQSRNSPDIDHVVVIKLAGSEVLPLVFSFMPECRVSFATDNSRGLLNQ